VNACVVSARVAFGRRLRELRKERGISQDSLSDRTGIHATAIGRMERGLREPRLTTILCFAYGLGVEPGALLNKLGEQSDLRVGGDLAQAS
jgi:transcriptional regulator with XRE-family HTH domain